MKILHIFIYLFSSYIACGQAKGQQLYILFEESIQTYHIVYKLSNGQLDAKRDRVVGQSQIGIVAPMESELKITNNHAPNSVDGTPSKWDVSNSIRSCEGNAYFSILNTISSTVFLPTMQEGDSVRLFSFTISPQPQCPSSVRIFEEGIDPRSSHSCMYGRNMTTALVILGSIKSKSNIDNTKIPSKDNFQINISDQPCVGNMIQSNIPGVWSSEPKNAFKESDNGIKLRKEGAVTLHFQSHHPCVNDTTFSLNIVNCEK